MPDIDLPSGYTNDTPLGRLASELRARGAELREPNRAAGARRVPVLEPMLEGVWLPVWESAHGEVFLAGLYMSAGEISAPDRAADRIMKLLRERGRRC